MITKTRKQNFIQWLKEYGNNNVDTLVISQMAYFSWAATVMPTSQIFLDVSKCHLKGVWHEYFRIPMSEF